jgi:hypothetical protein
MTLEEAVQFCKDNCLTVAFGQYGVIVKDEGMFYSEVWDSDFISAVERMKENLGE